MVPWLRPRWALSDRSDMASYPWAANDSSAACSISSSWRIRGRPRVSRRVILSTGVVTFVAPSSPARDVLVESHCTHRHRSAICRLSDQERCPWGCLLYTSDAADDLLCVDLGGRRIIKK